MHAAFHQSDSEHTSISGDYQMEDQKQTAPKTVRAQIEASSETNQSRK
jgi:hypothetical protein